MTTVIQIVRQHLISGGFDGLVAVDAECGCLCDDLVPCSGDFSGYEPAYRGVDLDGETGDWAMYRTKEGAAASVADAMTRRASAAAAIGGES